MSGVSVIIPARDAAATLAETLASLAAQSFTGWEAIIVDDGSTDATAALAAAAAAADPRIRLLRQPNAGVSAARNAGIAAARHDHLLFLDADDWIAPTHLACLHAALGQAEVAYCGYARVTAGGEVLPPAFAPEIAAAPFAVFADHCRVAIHCVLAPRRLVVAVGGFDPALRICEDWDLWARLARAGTRWAEVAVPLAFYRMRAGSSSVDYARMAADGAEVLARCRRADGRVANPAHPPAAPNLAALSCFRWWCAIADAAAGNHSARWMRPTGFAIAPDAFAALARDALTVGGQAGPDAAPRLWISALPHLTPLLAAATPSDGATSYDTLIDSATSDGTRPTAGGATAEGATTDDATRDAATTGSAVSDGTMTAAAAAAARAVIDITATHSSTTDSAMIDSAVTDSAVTGDATANDATTANAADDSATTTNATRDDAKGRLYRAVAALEAQLVRADPLDRPWPGHTLLGMAISPATTRPIIPPPGVDRLCARIGSHTVELPLWGSLSAREAVRAAVAAVGHTAFAEGAGGWRATAWRRVHHPRARVVLLRTYPNTAPAPRSADTRAAILATAATTPPVAPAPAAPPASTACWTAALATAEGWNEDSPYEALKAKQTLALIDREPIGTALEIGCGGGAITAALAARTSALTVLDISADAVATARTRCPASVRFIVGDVRSAPLPGPFDLILCSETLYYLPEEDLPATAARLRDALAEGGRLVTANLLAIDDAPDTTGFETDLGFGGQRIAAALAATPGLTPERSLRSELYRIDLFRRGPCPQPPIIEPVPCALPAPRVQQGIVWGGAVARRGALCATVATDAVPILMYHRIADHGPAILAPYRTAPAMFEAQLRLLRRHGFHPVGSAELAWYRQRGEPLPGRPVLLTFDDGYRDFHDTAWPILYRNGFFAEVFLPTAHIGGAARWDADHGPPAPLMDWADIVALAAAGARFGSHLVSHRPASSLTTATLLEEAVQSRAIIARHTGRPVPAVAAPYGDVDERIVRIFGEAGYALGYTTTFGLARHAANPLALPRIEVPGGITLGAFAALLGLPA